MTNTTPSIETYRVGDIIEYRPLFGGIRRLQVVERDPHVRNGEPGFTGEELAPTGAPVGGYWGYDRQIIRVVAWSDCPAFDELPVRARIDVTGARRWEYGLAEGQTHVEVQVTDLVEAASGRRYAQYLWRDEYFMAPLEDVDFDV